MSDDAGNIVERMAARVEIILAVDDSEDDLMLLQRAFEQHKVKVPLHIVSDGADAVAWVQGEGEYANRQQYPFPALMILDLKMPRVNGFDVLRRLKAMELRVPPMVVVMSTTALAREKELAMELGATDFYTKPVDFDELRPMVNRLVELYQLATGTMRH